MHRVVVLWFFGCLVVALLLVPASSASAARTVAIVPDYISQGPVLAGEQVAWKQEGCLTNCFTDPASDCMQNSFGYALKVATPGRAARTLATGKTSCSFSGPSGGQSNVAFAISATHLAIGRSSSAGDDTQTEARSALMAGPRTGSLMPVYRCVSGRYDPRALFVLSGDGLLFDPEPCRESVRKLTVRDLATGDEEELPVAATSEVFSVDFAGRYVAYLRAPATYEFEQIVVYDRAARANAYTVEFAPELDEGFALRPDGAIAVSVDNPDTTPTPCATDRFEWYSPAEPFAHPLAVEGCYGSLDFAGDRILYSAGSGRLEARTLAGEVTPVARFGRVNSYDGFDADSRQVTYSLPRCGGGYSIMVHQLAAPPATAGPPGCPAHLRSSTIRARDAYATVRLRCPRGCQGQLRLSHKGDTIARRPFRATQRSAARGVRVQLFVGFRSRLRRAGRLPAQVHLLTHDRAQTKRRLTRRAILARDAPSGS